MRHKLMEILGLFVVAFLLIAGDLGATPLKVPPMTVTASRTASGSSPNYAVDGNTATKWESGAYANQWIQLDLGRTVAIQKIRLLPYQTQTGSTALNVYVGQVDPPPRLLTTISRGTKDNQWIEIPTLQWLSAGAIRYVRITATASSTPIAWREIEIQQGAEYFGYFGDACDFCPGDADSIADTAAAGANLHMVARVDDPANPFTAPFNPNVWLPSIQEAVNHGGKVVLGLTMQLFDSSLRQLRTDWQSQWSAILSFIKNNAPANSIVALYPLDEPYNHVDNPTDRANLAAQLQMLADRIHSDTLSQLGARLPIAAIHRITELDCGPTYCPKTMFDWIGFDCYTPWNSCGGHGMDYWISELRSELVAGQRMIAVPPAYNGDNNELPTQWDIVTSINYWHKQITTDPSYVLVMPFRWATIRDGQLNEVKDRLVQFTGDTLNPGTKSIHAEFQDASSWISGGDPFLAFDNDTTVDMWNSGVFQPAFIQADFGGSTRVNNIGLRVAQNPSGTTTHTVYGNKVVGGWTTLATLTGSTQEGQLLTWTGSADVYEIRVTTTQSNSWVAWHDIQISRN